jgi:nucleoid-associated protein YgaU
MVCLDKLRRSRVLFAVSGNIFRKWRIYFSIITAGFIVLSSSASSSAQDLGALARQEQLRKQAQPPHPSLHVYTNDDLVRTKILLPEDQPVAEAPPKSESSERVEKPPQVVTRQDVPEVPLGDIAREYRQQKLARLEQSRKETQPVCSSHVYTNEEMAHSQILTPEDRVTFGAARANSSPALMGRPPEPFETDADLPEVPPGETAKLYNPLKLPSAAPDPGRYQLFLRAISLASPILPHSPTKRRSAPRGNRPVSLPIDGRVGNRESPGAGSTGYQMVTVKQGDSLWRLARQYRGRGSRWRALLKANPWIRNPNYLRTGSQMRI